jgi:hypothetical protein
MATETDIIRIDGVTRVTLHHNKGSFLFHTTASRDEVKRVLSLATGNNKKTRAVARLAALKMALEEAGGP